MLYSDSMKPFVGELPQKIQKCLSEIKAWSGLEDLTVLAYDKDSVAIKITIHVSLPMRGPVGGIDIREKEPMFLQISLSQYPSSIPVLHSDRKDFPANQLPHLYGRKKGEPAALCLIRNSPDEWFANKRIADLLTVGAEWLFKAAAGILADDGNEWDPVRIVLNGQHIYQYDSLHAAVVNRNRVHPELPCAFVCGYAYKHDHHGERRTYRSLSTLPAMGIRSLINEITKPQYEEKYKVVFPMFSILAWDENDKIDASYNTDLPRTYGDLKAYVKNHGIDLDEIIYGYVSLGCHLIKGIPFILAVKRPKKMIGYDGNFEFFNFRIEGSEMKNNRIPNKAEVTMQRHIEPFSKSLAAKLTGEERNDNTLFVGAGSLGSKMIMHDTRTGKMGMGIVDHDELLEHNLARHTLYQNHIGLNKAEAMIKEVDEFFSSDIAKKLEFFDNKLHNVFESIKNKYDLLVDTTAGKECLHFLSSADIPAKMMVARAEMADDGKLGLLYVEGKDRNPRIDDLVNLTYFEALNNTVLETWRRNDAKKEITNLSVGLGCSSTTVVIPDDVISFHASVFSKTLYKITQRNLIGEKGLLYRSIIDNTGLPILQSESMLVDPFEIYPCLEGSGWTVRMRAGLTKKMLNLCKGHSPVETGGVLIGIGNYKTKTIHVFDIIEEPQDSKGTCVGFTRGIKGLPEEIDSIKERTGNVIGYIGEWHTHPMNLQCLSGRDQKTIAELILVNRKEPIPTCAVIVTREKLLPYIFE